MKSGNLNFQEPSGALQAPNRADSVQNMEISRRPATAPLYVTTKLDHIYGNIACRRSHGKD
jgi:hypothetical protein